METQHILSKSKGDEFISEVGIFVLAFVITVAIVCVADFAIEVEFTVK